jgi:hypothetical protein
MPSKTSTKKGPSKAAQEKAAKVREAKRAAAEKARAQERQDAIKSGALIEGPGDVEFHRVEEKSKDTLDQRAVAVLAKLEKTKTPIMGKDLQSEFGGGWPLYIPMFSVLKAQGLIVEYRRRTGERGGGGVAYLHTNHLP